MSKRQKKNPNKIPATPEMAARELKRPSYGFEIDRVFYQRARDEMLRPSIDSDQIKLEEY